MIDDLDAAAAAYADAIRAATDLVDRTGARELDLGYLDGALPGQTYWFAHAEHAGARVSVENHHGPREALEALARQLLTGTRCPHCGRPVTLTDEDAATADDRRCHYRRVGPRWVRGCEPARRPSAKRRHRHHRHRRRRH